jgi:hypothetical protein
MLRLFYMEMGNSNMAHRYITSAHLAYMKWGAVAKARQLEADFPAGKLQRLQQVINYTTYWTAAPCSRLSVPFHVKST